MSVDPNNERDLAKTEPQIELNASDVPSGQGEGPRTTRLTAAEAVPAERPVEVDVPPANRPKKVYAGMWGTTEIAAICVGLAAVVGMAALFLFFVVPAKRNVDRDASRHQELTAELAGARAKYGDITSTEAQVAKLVQSADDFETNYLPVAANGRTALYQRINGLIAGYGLVNTSGPDFAPLDIADLSVNTEEERGRARFQSLFPGDYVTMTLEGPYANLRRFIRDIETGRDFIVISSIELEPSDSTSSAKRSANGGDENGVDITQMDEEFNAPQGSAVPRNRVFNPTVPAQRQPQTQASRPKGRTVGEVVSLRLEMAAYYRRPNAGVTEEAQ